MGVRGDLGTELRALRVARGLSLMEAARRAGTSRGSLHRWENGENAPGTPALLRLLDGLGAEARDRARLAADADPRHVQLPIAENPLGPLAPPGELLRTLREARGHTQAELARHLGVSQPTVAKWEAGLAMPAGGRSPECSPFSKLPRRVCAKIRSTFTSRYRPYEKRARVREEVELYPFPLQGSFMLAMERELWTLAPRDPRWEAPLVEVMAWRSMGLFGKGEHTVALKVARQSLRLAESSGQWDAAQMAFEALEEIRVFRGADGASRLRKTTELLSRFRNPFVRARWMSGVAEVAGRFNLAQGRELWARATDLVRENESDEMFGGQTFVTSGQGLGKVDLDRLALRNAVVWGDRQLEPGSRAVAWGRPHFAPSGPLAPRPRESRARRGKARGPRPTRRSAPRVGRFASPLGSSGRPFA